MKNKRNVVIADIQKFLFGFSATFDNQNSMRYGATVGMLHQKSYPRPHPTDPADETVLQWTKVMENISVFSDPYSSWYLDTQTSVSFTVYFRSVKMGGVR